jgi:2'-5' RNA ligase
LARAASAYGLVVLPPPAFKRELLELRKRHPLLRSVAPPHITIKSPFIYRATGAIIVEKLEAVCQKFAPFPLQVGGIGSFGTSVLYLKVAETPELMDLHHRLVEELEGFVETFRPEHDGAGFHPHLTISEKLIAEDFQMLRQALGDYRPRAEFWVDQIHLLRGYGSWQITRSIPLGE